MVLIADPEVETGKKTAQAVASWGLTPILVHDGVEAMMSIQRMLPTAVVMDAALPKMFGFQVCEVLKRNESLRDIHVLLVGAIHNRERYRRAPTELYGADEYLERHELVEQLRGVLVGIGMPVGGTAVDGQASRVPSAPETAPSTPPAPEEPVEDPAPLPAPVAEPQPNAEPRLVAEPPAVAESQPIAEAQPVAEPQPIAEPQPVAEPQPIAEPVKPYVDPRVDPVLPPAAATAEPSVAAPDPQPRASAADIAQPGVAGDPRFADAERLARIVVSDIILYNPEKFDAGIRDGNLLDVMAPDLAEGRSLFDGRVDAEVRAERDFLVERMLQVARDRGMT